MHLGGGPSDPSGDPDQGVPVWTLAAAIGVILLPSLAIAAGVDGLVAFLGMIAVLVACAFVRTLWQSKKLEVPKPEIEPVDAGKARKRGLINLKLPPPPKPTPWLERRVPTTLLAVLIGLIAPLALKLMSVGKGASGMPSHISGPIATSGMGTTAAQSDAARGGFGSTASRSSGFSGG